MKKRNVKKVCVGIDVSKLTLDVCVLGRETFRASNSEQGFAELIQKLKKYRNVVVAMEHTGGYERALAAALKKARIVFSVLNPSRVRAHAKASGVHAKTDKVDAEVLANYANTYDPPASVLRSEIEQRLNSLVLRRKQVVDERARERNRLKAPAVSDEVRDLIAESIERLTLEVDRLDKLVGEVLTSRPEWVEKVDLLSSLMGIGRQTEASLVALLPELGTLNKKSIVALVGLAARARESGQYKGKRSIDGGRAAVRAALYMATLSAVKNNPVLNAHYNQLLARNKPKKVALVACMRKVLTILNAMLRTKTAWKPELAAPKGKESPKTASLPKAA